MTTFVPRTKNDRLKLVDNRRAGEPQGPVTLKCGCESYDAPTLSWPGERWWCCGAWQRQRR